MFGRKKDEEEDDTMLGVPTEGDAAAQQRVGPKPVPPGGRPAPYATAKPEARRAQEHPRAGQNGNGNVTEAKRLIVGREIVLSGAIHSCDKLVVEGRVEANLADCHEMEIAESGTFKGEASIDVAIISGHFEGTLIARELLLIRAKGSVSGSVRFGRLEVERGGEIVGDVSVVASERTRTIRVVAGNGAAVGNGVATEESVQP